MKYYFNIFYKLKNFRRFVLKMQEDFVQKRKTKGDHGGKYSILHSSQ